MLRPVDIEQIRKVVEGQGFHFLTLVRHFQAGKIREMQDDYATAAMQAILSRPDAVGRDFDEIACEAHLMSDAMWNARDARCRATSA